MAAAVWAFPLDCDGAFANYDGAHYGVLAERLDPGSISPHHPLFHLAALGLVPPLRALGVAQPGQIAVRLLSGAGAAWLLLQIAALSGRRRPLAGAGFAAAVFAGAGFLVLAGTGETVLPGAAAALFALTLAARKGAGPAAVGAALTLALLLRQDNLFVVPGVAAALAAATPAERRWKRVAAVLAASAAATIAGYVGAWLAGTRGEMPFLGWLIWLARDGPWSKEAFHLSSFGVYLGSVSKAMTGPFFGPQQPSAWIGAAYAAAFVVAGVLLRGSDPERRFLLAPAGLTLATWAVFHSWWLASNFEWLVPAVALLAAAMAALTRGEPATAPALRRAGAVLLLGLTAWLLAAGAPNLARFRERRLAEAIEDTARTAGDARWLGVGNRAQAALDVMHIQATPVPTETDIAGIIALVEAEVRKSPGRTIAINDRFTLDPLPKTVRNRACSPIDFAEPPPGVAFLRRDGLVYGAVWEADAADSRSRPASR